MQQKQDATNLGNKATSPGENTLERTATQEQLNSSFLSACAAHDEKRVLALLKRGADVHSTGCYPAIPDVRCGALALAILGELKATANTPDNSEKHRTTTLTIFRHLLRAGANPSTHAEVNVALIEAADGLADLYPLLEAHGLVLPGSTDHHKQITLAIVEGDIDTLQAFAEAGYDLNEMDSRGDSPLHIAVTEKVRLRADVLAPSGDSRAEQWGEYFASLRDLGIDLNAPDHDGQSPLQIALRTFQPDVAVGLVIAGADPNEDCGWIAPVNIAASSCGIRTVRKLIFLGAQVEPLRLVPQRLVDKEMHKFLETLRASHAFSNTYTPPKLPQ